MGKSLAVYLPMLLVGVLALFGLTRSDSFLSEQAQTLAADDPSMVDAMTTALMTWLVAAVAISWLCAAVFLAICALRAPNTSREEASAKGLWYALGLLSIVAIAVFAWNNFFNRALAADLNLGFVGAVIASVLAALTAAYYAASVLAVASPMTPSVPGAHIFRRR